MARRRVVRCWIRGHNLIRERDARGVWSFVCSTCGYTTPILYRTADERDAMARRFPTDRSRSVGQGGNRGQLE